MEGTKDYLEALRPHLPPDVLQLPEERQLAYISELLSHHRHQRCDRHVNTAPKEEECYDLQHKTGKGVLHVGRHRHGVNDLTTSHRCNLILWCRSSEQRAERVCDCAGAGAGHTPCPEWCSLHRDMSKYVDVRVTPPIAPF